MKTIKFLAIVVLSAAIAMGVAYVCADTFNGFAAISIFGGLFVALIMGAFDVPAKKGDDSIKHKMGSRSRSYGHAAIFVGTAIVFMGTTQQCEDLADDLWHRGVQAEVTQLTGEETFEIL